MTQCDVVKFQPQRSRWRTHFPTPLQIQSTMADETTLADMNITDASSGATAEPTSGDGAAAAADGDDVPMTDAPSDVALDTNDANEPDPATDDTPMDEEDSSASSSDTISNDSDESADADSPITDPSALLLTAISHKESGNAAFKSSNYIEATRSYRKGTTILKPLNKNNTGDEQVKGLLITLQTNLSMVCYKQEKYKMSRDVAAKALEIDGENVKALYRRAMACRALGDVDGAKVDLKLAYKLEPTNVAVKKELVLLKKSLEEYKANERERLKKAFSKSGSLLYQDKEADEAKKAKEKEEKERAAKAALEERKKQWEDECVRRMSLEEEAISFEDWEKERKQKEEEEQKARDRAKKEEEDRKRKERKAAREAEKRNAKSNADEDSDDDELTEKELAMLRGYKKTSDGRTTSYFTREQTDHEKELIGCIKPKRLDESATASSNGSGNNTPTPLSQSTSSVGSAWNQAGTTWEEKDTTEWCKQCLKSCLLDATAAHHSGREDATTYIAVVKGVDTLTGDASVALAGGKKRYIYDFHASLKYEILNDGDEVIASGSLKLPDINSATTAEEELDVDVLVWKKAPVDNNEGGIKVVDVEECRRMLVGDVRKSVLRYVEKFNANF